MVFPRTRLWSVTTLLVGAVLAAGTLVAPAEALTQRTISFRAGTTTALAGTQITVAGTISKAPKGTYVYLQKFNGDYWQIAALATTADGSGDYRTKITLPKEAGTHAYRAYVPPSSTLSAATSGTVRLTALRKVATSLKASSSTVSLGTQAKLLGKVSPFLAGTKVTVERYNGFAWKFFTTRSLSSTGTFVHAFYPKATMSYRFKVPRTGVRAAATSAALRVTVTGGAAAPTITTTSLPDGQTGASYFQGLTSTGGSGTWSLLSGALPSGLVLKSVSGVIAGSPKTAGTSGFKVMFTADSGLAAAKAMSITIRVGPVITTTSLPAGSRGTAYSATLQKTGQDGSWTLSAGELPAGVTLNGTTGALTGTPTQDGTFPVTFTFTETASGLTTSKSFQLQIADPPDPVITTTSLPDGVVGTAYSKQLAKTGNAGTWTLSQGSLPAGLSLSTGGLISGTPTSGPVDPEFTVTFTEPNGTFDTATYRLHVSPAGAALITPETIPNGTQGVDYLAQLSTTASGIKTWSVSGGSLPAGLSLGSGNGRITGTPTTAGTYTFIVKYTVFLSPTTNTKVYTIRIAAGS